MTTLELTAADGHQLSAHRAVPDGAPRGGVVVVQEIFGVNGHIRSVADGYAADGYLAVAPALFDRAQRGFETGYTPQDIEAGRSVMQHIAMDDAMKDVAAAAGHAAGAGKVGIVGYCWGGTVAWLAAARVPGLACSVPYYGGSIFDHVGVRPACPVMFQFGERDTRPSLQQARAIAAAHPGAVAHFYPAGHGFNCDQRGSYDAASAALARRRTLEFLAKHVG
jgi:carboxymethylenebutenolidase